MLFQMKQYNFLSTQRPVSSRVNSKLQHVKNYLNSNLNNYMRKRSNLIFDEIHYTKWSGRRRRLTCDLNICAVSLCISIHISVQSRLFRALAREYMHVYVYMYMHACRIDRIGTIYIVWHYLALIIINYYYYLVLLSWIQAYEIWNVLIICTENMP